MRWEDYPRDPGKSRFNTVHDRYKNTRELNYDDWHDFSKWYGKREGKLKREIEYLEGYLAEPWRYEPRWTYDNMHEGEKLTKRRESTRMLKILRLELHDHQN